MKAIANFPLICRIVAPALLCVSGCGSNDVTPPSLVSEDLQSSVTTLAVPSNWIGTSLGIAPPRLQAISKINVVTPTSDWQPDYVGVVESTTPPSSLSRETIITQNDGTRYRMLLAESDMQKIGDEFRKNGLDQASSSQSAASIQKAWANEFDNRTIQHYSAGDWPRDTVGLLHTGGGGVCTGTLFSTQLVLTAQHCLWDGKGNFVWPTGFSPGQDGTTLPYPTRTIGQAVTESSWQNNNCGNSNGNASSTCLMYDWAIVVLTGSAGNGSMGFSYNQSDSAVAGWPQYNRGYPAVSGCGAPAGDVANTMWMSQSNCQIGSFYGNVGGYNRNYNFGCATSAGQSGGPLYTYATGNGGPMLVGIYSAEKFCGTQQYDSTPNIAFRIDQYLFNLMSTWKSSNP